MLRPLAPSATRLVLIVLDESLSMYIAQLCYHFIKAFNMIGLGSHALNYEHTPNILYAIGHKILNTCGHEKLWPYVECVVA